VPAQHERDSSGWAPAAIAPGWAAEPTGQATARIGLFVGGYFALAFAFGVHGLLADALGDVDLLQAALAGAFAGGLLWWADRARGTDLDALAVMAAFGSTAFVTLTTAHLASSTGADGRFLFWTVTVVALPVAVATLLWMPHPVLGINVALGAAVLVIASPLGSAGASVPAGKALLLALVLAGLAVAVDLRTRSRAGSLLHYSAVAVLAVAELLLGIDLDAVVVAPVLTAIAVAELVLALLLRRRSWAVSAWITLAVAVLTACGASVLGAALGGLTAVLAAVPLVATALALQREGEQLRALLLDALPPDLAASFPP
jgi:hypothetical protein